MHFYAVKTNGKAVRDVCLELEDSGSGMNHQEINYMVI